MTELAGSRILIVGASGVLGALLAHRLADAGAKLALSGRDPARLAAAGLHGELIVADLTEPGSPERIVERAVAALGGLDGVVIAAGAASLDPLDAIFEGLDRAGGRMVRHGTPAHPGSLLWLARWRDRPVLGMPACGMFSQATSFDLVLPRILAGETVENAELAEIGHGGLLSRDSAWRFPPYRTSAARGELPE